MTDWRALSGRAAFASHRITDQAIALRASLEDRLDDITANAWQHVGETDTIRFCELVETVGDRLIARVDATAGEKWMLDARRSTPRTLHVNEGNP